MRTRVLFGVLALLVLVGGIGLGLALGRSSGSEGSGRPASRASGTSDPAAAEVVNALKRLSSDPASLVAASARGRVGSSADQGVPKGSTVVADPATWRSDGAGGGVIVITLTAPGASPQDYVAVMVHETGGWKVAETYPVGATS